MKIYLDSYELEEMKKFLNTMEENGAENMFEKLKESPLVVKCDVDWKKADIEIDSQYITDFFGTVAESSNVIVPLAKGLVSAWKILDKNINVLLDRHLMRKDKEKEEFLKAQNPMKSAVKFAMQKYPSAAEFHQLPKNTQEFLAETFGNNVVEAFNNMRDETRG